MGEKFEIPREHWYQFIDIFTRIDEELATLIKQNNVIIQLLSEIAGKPKVSVVTEEKPIVVRQSRANTYKVYTIDLSIARTDEPLGLKKEGIVASSLTIIRADAPFNIKINSKGHDSIDASVGLTFDDWDVEEIYVTNGAAASGNYGKIYVEWGG